MPKDVAQVFKQSTQLYLDMASYRHQSQPGVDLSRTLSKELFSLNFGCYIGYRARNGQSCSRAHDDTAYSKHFQPISTACFQQTRTKDSLASKVCGKEAAIPFNAFLTQSTAPHLQLLLKMHQLLRWEENIQPTCLWKGYGFCCKCPVQSGSSF